MSLVWLAATAALAVAALLVPALSLEAACAVTGEKRRGFLEAAFLSLMNGLATTLLGAVFSATVGLVISFAVSTQLAAIAAAAFGLLASGAIYSAMLNTRLVKGLAVACAQWVIGTGMMGLLYLMARQLL